MYSYDLDDCCLLSTRQYLAAEYLFQISDLLFFIQCLVFQNRPTRIVSGIVYGCVWALWELLKEMLDLRQTLLERVNIAQKRGDSLRCPFRIFDESAKFENPIDRLTHEAEETSDAGGGAKGFH